MNDRAQQKTLSISVKIGIAILIVMYAIALLAEFIAPYDYREQSRQEPSAPVSTIVWSTGRGGPFVCSRRLVNAREWIYEDDCDRTFHLRLFSRGSSYLLLGLVPTNLHLFGVNPEADGNFPRIHLLGTDQLGRDRFSRLVVASRFSLLASPAGTVLACLLGILIGAVSGYAGRTLDSVLMAVTDTVIALPTLILILAARAAFPLELPAMTAAGMLIAIFAFTGWAEMARLTRGQVVAVRNLEFISAARALGAGETRILSAHILPNIAGPLLVQATLMLPAFFLAEVALSFFGVGLQEPEPSLGNMLNSASDLTQLAYHPLLLLSPAVFIFIFVFATRLLTRGRREKAI